MHIHICHELDWNAGNWLSSAYGTFQLCVIMLALVFCQAQVRNLETYTFSRIGCVPFRKYVYLQ